jgi:entericidin B
VPRSAERHPAHLHDAAESVRFTADFFYSMEAIVYLKIIAALLALGVMAGCNTMAGAGKDIQKGGESIENSAEKHK